MSLPLEVLVTLNTAIIRITDKGAVARYYKPGDIDILH